MRPLWQDQASGFFFFFGNAVAGIRKNLLLFHCYSVQDTAKEGEEGKEKHGESESEGAEKTDDAWDSGEESEELLEEEDYDQVGEDQASG